MTQALKNSLGETEFDLLYRDYYQGVSAVIRRHRISSDISDDLIQNIFLIVWLNYSDLKDPAALPGWILTIARREALREIKRRRNHLSISPNDKLTDEEGPTFEVIVKANDFFENYELEHSLELVREYIRNHKNDIRGQVAKKFYLDEIATQEIADEMGLNLNTVLSHLRRFRIMIDSAFLQLREDRK